MPLVIKDTGANALKAYGWFITQFNEPTKSREKNP
jgi:hypothetical protein